MRWEEPTRGRGGASGWQGWDGGLLIGSVVHYDNDGGIWMGFIRGVNIEGRPRFATAEEAMAAVDAEWVQR